MTATELWVDRTNFRNTRIVEASQPELGEGEIRVAIDKFAITSNNVGYAVSGDMIGYWQYFPTGEEPWGKVTVWGMADVVESNSPDIKVGERLYGFFPMSSQKLFLCHKLTSLAHLGQSRVSNEVSCQLADLTRSRSPVAT